MPCWGDWGAGDDVDWASVPLHTIDALPEAYRGATCYVLRSSTKYAMAEGILLQIESHGWIMEMAVLSRVRSAQAYTPSSMVRWTERQCARSGTVTAGVILAGHAHLVSSNSYALLRAWPRHA